MADEADGDLPQPENFIDQLLPDDEVQWGTCTTCRNYRARHAIGAGPAVCCRCWHSEGLPPVEGHVGAGECDALIAGGTQ